MHAGDSLHTCGQGKENTKSYQCQCPALIRLLRTKDNGWYITEHRVMHTHSFSGSCDERVHWPSHKHIDIHTKNLVRQLRENNLNIGKVNSIIGSFFGSMENVPLTKPSSGGNLCGRLSRDQAGDDAWTTKEVLAEIGAEDPNFCQVQADDDEWKTMEVSAEIRLEDPDFRYRVRADDDVRKTKEVFAETGVPDPNLCCRVQADDDLGKTMEVSAEIGPEDPKFRYSVQADADVRKTKEVLADIGAQDPDFRYLVQADDDAR